MIHKLSSKHKLSSFAQFYSIKDPLSSPDYLLTIPIHPNPVGLDGTAMGNSFKNQIFPIKLFSLTQRMIGTVRLNIAHNLSTLHDHVSINIHSSSSSDPANISSQS